MCFISVDLPQPEPPRMTKTSPRATVEATCSKMVRLPKRCARSSTRIDRRARRLGVIRAQPVEQHGENAVEQR